MRTRFFRLCLLPWAALPALTQPLPGTKPLVRHGDLAQQMVAAIDRYLMDRLATSAGRRTAAMNAGPRVLRERLRHVLGVVDERVPFEAPELEATLRHSSLLASTSSYEVHIIRWPVLEGVHGEGLLLRPLGTPRGRIVALPDADWTPEVFCGLAPGVPEQAQIPRQLAETGFLVVVPVLIDRSDRFSGKDGVRLTNQPHREFIFRMAYEMGRHIIGYELQKILALVDWFASESPRLPMGVAGYGEGGLLALHAAALDERIQAAWVSGYFSRREDVWRQPIYRSYWGQLEAFGDAELAGLVAPRALVIEASPHPEVIGPPPEREGRRGAAPGRITTPPIEDVRAEFRRARDYYERRGAASQVDLVEGPTGSRAGLQAFVRALDPGAELPQAASEPKVHRPLPDAGNRQKRQVWQLVEFTQRLVRQAPFERARFFQPDPSGLEAWQRSLERYRKMLWEEVIGRLPDPTEPLVAETRRAYETRAFTGYEVVLPVWPGLFAYGILLVPNDLQPGERRPVVVCQHGLEGRPQHLIEPPDARLERIYARYAARLAEEGFVIYAPQNPYLGGEGFRVLLRKAHPQKLSLFSFIIGQHQRTLEWLASLPFVDGRRIGFYGLSYGGKTAMRVPAVLPGYALSICSADFNEWIWKITSVDQPFSYMYTNEYDMLEFNLGNTFNYAEMAAMIAPRPFMVERGHDDPVSIDEWVAYEYARVRRWYAKLGIPERTAIEFFHGGHQIHGEGTFEFLRRFLGPPRPLKRP